MVLFFYWFQEMVVTTLNALKLVLLHTDFGSSFHQGKVHKSG